MPKLNVFMSHLNVEANLADILTDHISRDFIGLVKVFVSSDTTSIPVGSKWLEEVTGALKAARLQLVLCSANSVQKPWINYEVGGAAIAGVPVIPICHTDFTPAQLPVPLSESEGIRASDPEQLRSVYRRIAEMLDSEIPDVDFTQYAAEIFAFENDYRKRLNSVSAGDVGGSGEEVIRDPRVLCLSSKQFLRLGFENQLELVLNAFPSSLGKQRVLDSRALQALIVEHREVFEIIHISAYVCPRSGTVYFSEVDTNTGGSTAENVDMITADALADLCLRARTRLVVIGSGDSLMLATTLMAVANVIAPREMVSAKMMAVWVETFYRMLRTDPLAGAFDFANKASGAKMRLIGQQKDPVRVQFMDQTAAQQL
jgi:hypothetical protein